MHYLVYITINNITGERYIGQHKTKNLNDNYLGSGKLLKENINKYGRNNFEQIILCETDNQDDLNILEIAFIDLYEPELNISKGGESWNYVNENRLNCHSYKWELARRRNLEKAQEKQRFLLKHDENYRKQFIERMSKGNRIEIARRKRKGTYHNSFSEYNKTDLAKNRAKENAKKRMLWKGKNNPSFGKKWVKNEFESFMVPKDEVQKYLDNGYTLGHFSNDKMKKLKQ